MASFLEGLTVAGFSICIAMLLAVVGMIMIFREIKSESKLDIKSSIFSGQLQTGFVGVVIVFISLVLALFSLNIVSNKSISIQVDNVKIEFQGAYTRKAIFEIMDRLIPEESAEKNQ